MQSYTQTKTKATYKVSNFVRQYYIQTQRKRVSFLKIKLSIEPSKTPLRIGFAAAWFLHRLLPETTHRRCCFLPMSKEAVASWFLLSPVPVDHHRGNPSHLWWLSFPLSNIKTQTSILFLLWFLSKQTKRKKQRKRKRKQHPIHSPDFVFPSSQINRRPKSFPLSSFLLLFSINCLLNQSKRMLYCEIPVRVPFIFSIWCGWRTPIEPCPHFFLLFWTNTGGVYRLFEFPSPAVSRSSLSRSRSVDRLILQGFNTDNGFWFWPSQKSKRIQTWI